MGRLSPPATKGDRMHLVPRTLGRSSRVAAVIAVAALTLLVPAGQAQTPVADTEAEAHPAHIHSGTCDQLGGVVYERENGEGMELDIALAELNDSGHVGIAWLGDDGEGGTNVSVSLIEPEEME